MLHKQHGNKYLTVCYYNRYHSDCTIFRISPLVSSKDAGQFCHVVYPPAFATLGFIPLWLAAIVKDLTNNWLSWRRFISFVRLSLYLEISLILASIVHQNPTCRFFMIFHRVHLRSRVYSIWLLDACTFRCVAQYLLLKISAESTSAIQKDFSLRLRWFTAAGAPLVPGISCKNRRVEIVLTMEGETQNVK